MTPLSSRTKRAMDIVLGGLLLMMVAPLMLAIAVVILMTSGRPVLFGQYRPGLHGATWKMYKFRTMRPARDEAEIWHGDDMRMTACGRLLRLTSLDELPQLFHVVSGRMSLVGPRPLMLEYLPRYSPRHRRRHEVKPGITGLAQVRGRGSLTLAQRLELDIQYIDEWSLFADIKILLRTIVVVFQAGYVPEQTMADIDDLNLFPDSHIAA